ncbi:MAG: SAM-dependent methyltransferase [Firmicutes bacterium]|nr:SAM-dependent methyltransferase [Bacillota bacterium]
MSETAAEFVSLLCEAASSGADFKATLSKPCAGGEIIKVTYSPFESGAGAMIKEETLFRDGKMATKNYRKGELFAALEDKIAHFSQGNLMLCGVSAQYMKSKKGRETIVGAAGVRSAISSGNLPRISSQHDRKKNYFFDGSESWLRVLGVSDGDGRVHDKKRAKFREIERFTELLDDKYQSLPKTGVLNVCDLCCGKSYLSFAVYEYLTAVRGREVKMLCADLKADVIKFCSDAARKIGCGGMIFSAADVSDDKLYSDVFGGEHVHLVVSLHACDTATDIVLRRAASLGADLILSTPCCHHYLNGKLGGCGELEFITSHSMLSQKLTDAVTDGLRVKMLEIEGYSGETVELIDPEETPKNVMIRAVRKKSRRERDARVREYNAAIEFFALGGSYYDIYSSSELLDGEKSSS